MRRPTPEGPMLLKEAQHALLRSEENFRALIEQLPDQVWVHRAGRIVYVNPISLRCLGYTAAEFVGRDLLELVVPEDRELAGQRLRVSMEVGETAARFEARLHRRDGLAVFFEISARGVLFDGEPATLLMGHDITQRKELEAHLLVTDRMASIGMLAAGVAHEINNPLAYVIANLRFLAVELAEDSCSEEVTLALGEAQEGAERVRGIVRDLKTFSRSEDRKRGSVDLHRVLDSASNLAWNEIRHSARLVKDYERSPLLVEGDESRLGQVFLNLLVNAAQAIPEGAADRNEIRLITRAEPDGRILVEVRDTGPGMSAEIVGRLFTPFFTTKPKGIGTGLGLSICHQIVAAHGGEIRVASEVGRGTTFRVWLRPADLEEAEAVTTPVPRIPQGGARGRVLIVDDEPLLGNALRRLLAPHHDTFVVTNGKEALRCLTTEPSFDVIFCDLMMPVMSGPELYEAIVAIDPALARRIVFLSGGAFTDAANAFLQRTPNLRLEKPFEIAQLLAVVAQFLRPEFSPAAN